MRQISLFFFIASMISCNSSSSPISMDNEKDVRSALVGQWESTYLETFGGRRQVPKEQVMVVTLQENGNYDSRYKGGVIATIGKWSYNPATHQLKTILKETSYDERIVSLTDTELILTGYTFSDDKIVDSTIQTFRKL